MRTRNVVVTASLAALCFLAWGRAQAQYYGGDPNDANVAQGLTNTTSYQSIDSINLYNLQLTVPIPIGPLYRIGPKLNLQLYLTYNSRPPDLPYSVFHHGPLNTGIPVSAGTGP